MIILGDLLKPRRGFTLGNIRGCFSLPHDWDVSVLAETCWSDDVTNSSSVVSKNKGIVGTG